tara:strand:- start:364 stop:642 length:279 start_codon:yes stop_codon:yes gene_type:complete
MAYKGTDKFKINPSCISTSIEDKSVILNVDNGKYYELNHTAALIWDCLKREYIVTNIELELTKNYEVNKDSVINSLDDFLNLCISFDFIKRI